MNQGLQKKIIGLVDGSKCFFNLICACYRCILSGFSDAKNMSKTNNWKQSLAIISTHLVIQYQAKLRYMCFVMVAKRQFTLAFSVTDVQLNYNIQSNQF